MQNRRKGPWASESRTVRSGSGRWPPEKRGGGEVMGGGWQLGHPPHNRNVLFNAGKEELK